MNPLTQQWPSTNELVPVPILVDIQKEILYAIFTGSVWPSIELVMPAGTAILSKFKLLN
jgi:hypothetical protein